jgi:endonuclease/exonuclease/phosphatase family metal-dependent hydrolase
MDIQVSTLTINLHGRSDRWLERRPFLVGQLLEARPDLIGLQEVDFSMRQGVWLRKQLNMRLSGSEKEPYQLVQSRSRRVLRRASTGVGVLSRLPVLYHESLPLGEGGWVALRVHVGLPSHKTMDFVSVRLLDVPYEHEARLEQAMRLVGWLRSYKHVPIQVIAGDFSETPQGLAMGYFKQSFRSTYEVRRAHEPLATFPTALRSDVLQARCLDYILISTAVQRVLDAHIICNKHAPEDNTLYPSDHVGLFAMLEV